MARSRLLVVAAFLVSACVPPGATGTGDAPDAREQQALPAPTFAPVAPTPTAELGGTPVPPSGPGPARTSTPGDGGGGGGTHPAPSTTADPADPAGRPGPAPRGNTPAEPSPSAPAGPDPAVVASTTTDPAGDVYSPPLSSPPDWTDLRAGRVEAGPGDVVVTVGVAAPLPQRQPDPDTTMNAALFADLDGDGRIDLEVWANLADDGWYPAYRRNDTGTAHFGPDSGITARPEGDQLHLTLPPELFDGARRYRWSLATQWGPYATLGTSTAAHDQAPDRGPVTHG